MLWWILQRAIHFPPTSDIKESFSQICRTEDSPQLPGFGNRLSSREILPQRLCFLPEMAHSQWLIRRRKGLVLVLPLKTDLKFILSVEHPALLAAVSHCQVMGWLFPVLSPSATALSSLPQLLASGESLTNPVRASLHLRVCFLGNPTCNRWPSGSLPFIRFHKRKCLCL